MMQQPNPQCPKCHEPAKIAHAGLSMTVYVCPRCGHCFSELITSKAPPQDYGAPDADDSF